MVKHGLGCGFDATMPDSRKKTKYQVRKIEKGNIQLLQLGRELKCTTWTKYTKDSFEAAASASVSDKRLLSILGSMDLMKTSTEYQSVYGNDNIMLKINQ